MNKNKIARDSERGETAEWDEGELYGLNALIDRLMAHRIVTHYFIIRIHLEHVIFRITGKQCPWCQAFKVTKHEE